MAAAGTCALWAVAPLPANATRGHGPVTTTLRVTATVSRSCSLAAVASGNLVFDPSMSGGGSAVGALELRCTKKTPYVVALDAGQNADGKGMRRAAAAGAGTRPGDFVRYHIYRGAEGSALVEWTGASRGSGTTRSGQSDEVLAFTVRIVGSENPNPREGDYTDTITATVTF